MYGLARTRRGVLPNSHTSAVSNDVVNVGLTRRTLTGTGNSVLSSGRESHRGPTVTTNAHGTGGQLGGAVTHKCSIRKDELLLLATSLTLWP